MTHEEHDRRVDYLEFSVPDVAEAKRFYSAVFGWAFTDWGPDYASFADGRLAGGFAKAEEAVPGGPLVVIFSLDLAAIERAIKQNGGTVVKEAYEFPGGRRFHFQDPAGYELAVWSDR